MTNCTVANNHATIGGGGILFGDTLAEAFSVIENGIIWGNTVSSGGISPGILTDGNLTVNHSDLQASTNITGTGNFAADPVFVNASIGNYRLQCSSPCFSTTISGGNSHGNNSVVDDDVQDVDEDGMTDGSNSNPSEFRPDLDLGDRILMDVVDLGAYEAHARPDCPADVAPYGGDCNVNVADLLSVINHWTLGGVADMAPLCGGDGVTNVSDLLAVINAWGLCACNVGGTAGSMPHSITECMNACSEEYPGGGIPWSTCVDDCVEGLCKAHIIECD